MREKNHPGLRHMGCKEPSTGTVYPASRGDALAGSWNSEWSQHSCPNTLSWNAGAGIPLGAFTHYTTLPSERYILIISRFSPCFHFLNEGHVSGNYSGEPAAILMYCRPLSVLETAAVFLTHLQIPREALEAIDTHVSRQKFIHYPMDLAVRLILQTLTMLIIFRKNLSTKP